ncbi:MAG: hypothetical protein ABIJ17_02545 [Patescibacteria group bacterium]
MADNAVIINVRLEDFASNSLKDIQDSLKKTSDSVMTFGKAWIAVKVAMKGFDFVKDQVMDLVNATAEFERMGVALKTVTGNAYLAQQGLEWIKEFTATTPYQLQDVGNAFTRLKALGIENIPKELAMIGDLASAFGKDITTALDAFTGVLVGRTVMLKQFGVTVNQIGEQMTFNWAENGRAMTKTINKNRDEIIAVLHDITNRFKGSMQNLMGTFIGLRSNLFDIINIFKEEFFKGDMFNEIKASVLAMRETLAELMKDAETMKAIKIVFYDLLTLVKALASAFMLISASLADLTMFIFNLYRALPKLIEYFKDFAKVLYTTVISIVKALQKELQIAILSLVPYSKKAIEKLTKEIKGLEADIKLSTNAMAGSFERLKDIFSGGLIFSTTAISLMGNFGKALKQVKDNVLEYEKSLKLAKEAESLITQEQRDHNALVEKMAGEYSKLKQDFDKKRQDILEKASAKNEESMRKFFGFGMLEQITDPTGFTAGILGFFNVARASFDEGYKKLIDTSAKSHKKMLDDVNLFMRSYVTAFTKVKEILKGVFDAEKTGIKDFIDQISIISPLFAGFAQLAISKSDEATNKILGSLSAMGQMLPIQMQIFKSFGMIGEKAGITSIEIKDAFSEMKILAKDTATAMNTFFSDFFFNAMKGNFDSLSDAFNNFLDSILRSLTNILANNVTSSLLDSPIFGNIFGFNPNRPPSSETIIPQGSYSSLGRSINLSAQGNKSLSNSPVFVNIKNNSQSKVAVESVNFDMKKQVIDIVVEDALSNGRTARIFG